ncbi:MAG: hypothetical protein IPM60_00555 [Rhodospirillales bacterium]|nr:hypothetical protein [Rhodospirillales bacterium]
MIRKSLIAAAMAAFIATPAFAMHCPQDMAKIDAALAKNPQLTEEQLDNVKDLRATGEKLHKDGQHKESVEVLGKAMEILGIE